MKSVLVFVLTIVMCFSIVSAADISTEELLTKVSLKKGESVTRSVDFSSIQGGEFEVSLVGLDGASLESNVIVIPAEGSEKVQISFDSGSIDVGTYVGYLIIKDSFNEIKIPIVVEIESEDVFFDVNIDVPPQYNDISPGGRIVSQIRVFDITGLREENSLGPSDVSLEYTLKSLSGDLISFESENVIVDNQARISKTFIIPSDVVDGKYVVVVSARYSSSLGISTYIFDVSSSTKNLFSISDLDFRFLSVLVVMALFFFGLIIIFVIMARDRDKLLVELKKHNADEAKKQREFIMMQLNVLKQNKGFSRKELALKKEAEGKIENLRKKQNNRINEFKKLQKLGKTEDMNKMLKKWKSDGYNTLVLESKIKGMSSKDIDKKIKSWKKEGYKF